MRTAYILPTFALAASSCAVSAPAVSPTTDSVLAPLSSATDSPPIVDLEAPAVGVTIQLPERPTSPKPLAALQLPQPTSVVDAATGTFPAGHQPEAQTEPVPLPTEPADPSDPESVADFVVVLWANPQPAGESREQTTANWLTASFAAEIRTAIKPANGAAQRSAVTGTELFETGFETKVLVTIEQVDLETGAFAISVIKVLLTRTDRGWAVTSLEFKR